MRNRKVIDGIISAAHQLRRHYVAVFSFVPYVSNISFLNPILQNRSAKLNVVTHSKTLWSGNSTNAL